MAPPRPKYHPSLCPRCGARFTCKSGNVGQCACFGINLSPQAAQHLREQYDACLCPACLTDFAAIYPTEQTPAYEP